MKEIMYSELNGTGSYILTMTCTQCKREINRTKVLHNVEKVKKMYNDAETDPVVNWCYQCNHAGKVHIWDTTQGQCEPLYLLSLGGQQEEIDHFCFQKCKKVVLGCITIPTQEGVASFIPCRAVDCPYVVKEIDLGSATMQSGVIEHCIVRQLPSLPLKRQITVPLLHEVAALLHIW